MRGGAPTATAVTATGSLRLANDYGALVLPVDVVVVPAACSAVQYVDGAFVVRRVADGAALPLRARDVRLRTRDGGDWVAATAPLDVCALLRDTPYGASRTIAVRLVDPDLDAPDGSLALTRCAASRGSALTSSIERSPMSNRSNLNRSRPPSRRARMSSDSASCCIPSA